MVIFIKQNFINVNERGEYMKISYNGLWKILIDKNMNKKKLAELVSLSPATIAKMSRGGFVSMDVLYRIGKTLNVDIGDMVSIVNGEEKE